VKVGFEASRGLALLSRAPGNIVWTAAARAASFAIPLLVARRYGASVNTDAFFLAFGAITFFVAVGGVVLEQAIVPHAAALRGSGREAVEWLWQLVRTVGLIGVGLSAVSLAAVAIAARLQPRVELRALLTVGRTTGVAMIPTFAVLSSLAAGVLTGTGRYKAVCVGLLVRAVLAVAIVAIQPFQDVFWSLLTAFLGAEVGRAIFNIVASRWTLLNERKSDVAPMVAPARPSMSSVWRTTWPVSLSMAAAALSPIVDRVVAAGLMQGGVSLVEYGEKAYFLLVGTVVAGLQVTVLTHWSSNPKDGRGMWEELRDMTKLLCAASVLAVPALFFSGHTLASAIMGTRLTATVPEAAVLTGFYLVAIIPYTIGGLAVRALMARQRTRPILVLGIVKLGANIVGDVTLTSWVGLPGISLATVAAETLVALGALRYAHRDLTPPAAQ